MGVKLTVPVLALTNCISFTMVMFTISANWSLLQISSYDF